jgi:hypothetical protein
VVSEHKINGEAVNGSRTAAITAKSCPLAELNATSSPNPNSGVAKDNEEEAALKESIRSVYRLWKMSRRTGGDDDRDVFLRVTKEVIGLL